MPDGMEVWFQPLVLENTRMRFGAAGAMAAGSVETVVAVLVVVVTDVCVPILVVLAQAYRPTPMTAAPSRRSRDSDEVGNQVIK